MIQYFINRGGKNLSARRRAELERAKRILQRRAARQKATSSSLVGHLIYGLILGGAFAWLQFGMRRGAPLHA
jgi:Protein of unknown function (DUF3175)